MSLTGGYVLAVGSRRASEQKEFRPERKLWQGKLECSDSGSVQAYEILIQFSHDWNTTDKLLARTWAAISGRNLFIFFTESDHIHIMPQNEF